MKLQQECFSPLNILKLHGCLPAIKFVQLPLQAANPALILSKTVLIFILDFFSSSEHDRKVQLPWKQWWDAAWWQGSTLLGRWAWKSGVCWVQSHPGSSRLVSGKAEPGERLLQVQALVCKSGLGALEKVKPCFGKPVFLRLFLCFGLVRHAQIIQKERISQIKRTFAAEVLLVLFWDVSHPWRCWGSWILRCHKGTLH